MIFSVFQKNLVLGILGPPYCGIGATIRIGREMLCLPYAGFFFKASYWPWDHIIRTLFLDTFCGHFLGTIKCSAKILVHEKHNEKLNLFLLPINTFYELPGSTDNFCLLKVWDSKCCLFVYLHCIECLYVSYQIWLTQQTNAILSFPELLRLSP